MLKGIAERHRDTTGGVTTQQLRRTALTVSLWQGGPIAEHRYPKRNRDGNGLRPSCKPSERASDLGHDDRQLTQPSHYGAPGRTATHAGTTDRRRSAPPRCNAGPSTDGKPQMSTDNRLVRGGDGGRCGHEVRRSQEQEEP